MNRPGPRVRGGAAAALALGLLAATAGAPGMARAQSSPAVRGELARVGAAVLAARAQHMDPREIERRWGGLLAHDSGALRADTLDGRVLLACCGGSMNRLALAFVTDGHVVLARSASWARMLSDDWTEPRGLDLVFLVRPSLRAGGTPGPWCALLWCADQGSEDPHTLRALPLSPSPRLGASSEVCYGHAGEWFVGTMGEEARCEVLARRGEVRWRTFQKAEDVPGARVVRTRFDPYPTEASEYRLAGVRPFRAKTVRRGLVDDATWALVRAYRAAQGEFVRGAADVRASAAARSWLATHDGSWLPADSVVAGPPARFVLLASDAQGERCTLEIARAPAGGPVRWVIERVR